MDTFIHNKTDKKYRVLCEVINCTNGENDGQIMILYMNSEGKVFVREKEEFMSRFTFKEEYNYKEYIPVKVISGVTYKASEFSIEDYYEDEENNRAKMIEEYYKEDEFKGWDYYY